MQLKICFILWPNNNVTNIVSVWFFGSGQPKNKSAVSVYMEGRGKWGKGMHPRILPLGVRKFWTMNYSDRFGSIALEHLRLHI